MNEKALRVLEYPKMIEKLVNYAGSQPGKALCRQLTPSIDIHEIRSMQQETTDAVGRILKCGSVSFSGVTDMRSSIARLDIGSSLSIIELLNLCKILDVVTRVKTWSKSVRDEEDRQDSLTSRINALDPLTSLSREIHRCILSEDEIADDASRGLKDVRRQMAVTNDKVRSTLQSMVNGGARVFLQDAIITQRDGRFCLPVKSEYRSQVPGMIHDQSSTGSTLFIEPMAVVKLNNDLRELEVREKKEIEAVLATLSNEAAANSNTIIENISLLTQLDFIFARAMLSRSYNGYEPEFNTEGIVDIHKGRHPLLNPKTTVPVDIRIGKDFDLLVISGPNTGGKTVSLKTIGLFTLLGQSGLHIPAAEHSQLALFTEVYADIGDEQSIEQSLSTFSAHMTNIVSFWEHADEKSLVLFDELGAGTDPEEGAALAIAILNNLHNRGVRAIATTHYSELKIYALTTPGVENACCEFSVETLRPTYKLLIGVPGKSNAFAISKRLGLPDSIIDDAKEHISQEEENFEDVIADLEDNRRVLEADMQKIDRDKAAISKLRGSLESKEARLEASRDKILDKAREEAAAILREAKEYADQTIRRYNKLGGGAGNAAEMERERNKLREKMTGIESQKKGPKKAQPSKAVKPKSLRIGDSVQVLTLNLKGTVSTLPDAKGNLFVQMGILRSQVNVKDLEFLEEAEIITPVSKQTGSGKVRMSKSFSVSTEINLLGKTTDEAINELDKYLDDAYIAHLPSVRVVHGKGTGALRKAVHNYLRKQKHVASYRLGEFGEGDAGVTIVTFK